MSSQSSSSASSLVGYPPAFERTRSYVFVQSGGAQSSARSRTSDRQSTASPWTPGVQAANLSNDSQSGLIVEDPAAREHAVSQTGMQMPSQAGITHVAQVNEAVDEAARVHAAYRQSAACGPCPCASCQRQHKRRDDEPPAPPHALLIPARREPIGTKVDKHRQQQQSTHRTTARHDPRMSQAARIALREPERAPMASHTRRGSSSPYSEPPYSISRFLETGQGALAAHRADHGSHNMTAATKEPDTIMVPVVSVGAVVNKRRAPSSWSSAR